MNVIICGSSGFIGSNLVGKLKSEGHFVTGIDIEQPREAYGHITNPDLFFNWDMRVPELVGRAFTDFRVKPDMVYQLAANMGGAGYIFTGDHDAEVMFDSAMINLNVLETLRSMNYKGKVFYSSSACIYPKEAQNDYANPGLKESDAYPANPDSEYGWEKLFSERLYMAYARNYGLDVRIARFHNIYGPLGTFQGGKEKAPAAMCRKAIECKLDENLRGEIEVWGSGHQTRSFLYIDDCLDAVRLLMQSDYTQPINIGSEEMVTINQLAELAVNLRNFHVSYPVVNQITIKNIPGPVGVMGRNSDNDLIRAELNWEPKYTLLEGMKKTYAWIASQI